MGDRAAPFLGRAAERAALDAALGRAASQRAQVVLVRGPAGVGKSRLLQESIAAWGDRVVVALGRAVSIGGDDLPFAPLSAALRPLDAPWPPPDAPAGRSGGLRVLEALLDTVAAHALERPFVLILEDLHWADPSTVGAVDFLARNLGDEPVLLVGTVRDDGARGHPFELLRTELLRLEHCTEVVVGPLGAHDVAELADHHAGGALSPRDLAAVWRRGQGNPFHTEELARAFAVGDRGLPPTLAAILRRQIDEVPDDVARILRAAAVVGRGMAPEVIADIVGIERRDAEDALRAALDAGLVVPNDDGLWFRHALLREAVESTLLPSEARVLHAAVADRLDALVEPGLADAVAIARHRHLAGQRPAAHRAALRAADLADAARDPVAALAQLELAIEDADLEADELAMLLLRASATAVDAGEDARAEVLARRAGQIGSAALGGDVALRAKALLATAIGNQLRYDESYELAVEVVSAAADCDVAVRSELLTRAAGAMLVAGRFRHLGEVAEQALAAARVSGRRHDESWALGSVGIARLALGDTEVGLTMLESAEAAARGAGSPRLEYLARTNRAEALHHLGEHRRCLAVAVEGVEGAQRVGLARSLAPVLAACGALSATHVGSVDAARDLLSRRFSVVPATGVVMRRLAEARMALAVGDVATAAAAVSGAIDVPDDAIRLHGASIGAVWVEVALAGDDPVGAAVAAATAVGGAAPLLRAGAGEWALARAEALLALVPSRDPALERSVAEIRTLVVEARGTGAGARHRTASAWQVVAAAWRHGVGPLDRDRDREALLRADLAAEIGWLDLAEAVGALGDGDRDRAAALLAAVLASSSHPTVTRHAAAIAARARLAATASPQRDAADAWHLTERELEVLRL
ncbi:MAG: AAA family ATPase, partial [Ilumatobacteraceae bacterium]|nr:AAA family ATPase [Ilumatobacteraceae bacterium]